MTVSKSSKLHEKNGFYSIMRKSICSRWKSSMTRDGKNLLPWNSYFFCVPSDKWMLSILVLNSWMQWIKWCIESNGWSYLPIEMTENKMHINR